MGLHTKCPPRVWHTCCVRAGQLLGYAPLCICRLQTEKLSAARGKTNACGPQLPTGKLAPVALCPIQTTNQHPAVNRIERKEISHARKDDQKRQIINAFPSKARRPTAISEYCGGPTRVDDGSSCGIFPGSRDNDCAVLAASPDCGNNPCTVCRQDGNRQDHGSRGTSAPQGHANLETMRYDKYGVRFEKYPGATDTGARTD